MWTCISYPRSVASVSTSDTTIIANNISTNLPNSLITHDLFSQLDYLFDYWVNLGTHLQYTWVWEVIENSLWFIRLSKHSKTIKSLCLWLLHAFTCFSFCFHMFGNPYETFAQVLDIYFIHLDDHNISTWLKPCLNNSILNVFLFIYCF